MIPIWSLMFLVVGSLALNVTVARAAPAPEPEQKDRIAEIDRELMQNRDKIATAMKALKSLPCGTGLLERIAQARNDCLQLEELQKNGASAKDIAVLAERVREEDAWLEKLRVYLESPPVFDIESVNVDIANLKERNAVLEAERAALIKVTPDARQ